MDRLVAIGDIHGCVHTLKDLLNRVSYSSQTDTLVFIGDYIDRGYFSYEVVDMLIKLQHQVGKDKVVCLRGNHEQMAIDAYRHGNYPLWYRNGGRSTEYSFEKNGQDLANAISWFETLPLVYDTPEIIFCHAGLSYPLLQDNSQEDLLWGRDWIRTDTEEREKQVVFGHTPRGGGRAYTVPTGNICIDAGCVFGGRLCALVVQDDGQSACVYVNKNWEDDL